MSLTSKTTIGLFWNLTQEITTRGIGIVVTLLLARFLVPEDFGLIAMMAIFLSLGQQLMDSGFKQALIRLQSASSVDYSTGFYSNVILGLISYSILYIAAPYIANFYDEQRLINLIRIASLSVVITSFQTIQVVNLTKSLNFKSQLKARLPASMLSGVISIYLAYGGWGVWALVIQTLSSSLISTILLWIIQGWRPTLNFSYSSFKNMYGFGYKLFLSGLINITFKNMYVVVIAKIFSAPIAGAYFFADKMKELIVNQLLSTIQSVTYPALATIQDDLSRLKAGYKKIVVLMSIILFPLILFTAALAHPLFNLVLPQQWQIAIPYFQLLCIGSVMMPLHTINLNILQVKGRSDLFLYLELVKKAVNVILLFFTYKHGIEAIIIGQIFLSFFSYIPNSYFSKDILDYSVKEQLSDFIPILLIASIIAYLAYLASSLFNEYYLLAILVLAPSLLIVYTLCIFVFQRNSFNQLKSFTFNLLFRNKSI